MADENELALFLPFTNVDEEEKYGGNFKKAHQEAKSHNGAEGD